MKLNYLRKVLLLCMCLYAVTAFGQVATTDSAAAGEEGNEYSHCSLFYLTSYNQDALPFDDDCMVRDRYIMEDYHHLRVFGPIDGSMDLWKGYQWSINIFLPDVEGPTRLQVKRPKNLLDSEPEIADGGIFVAISDNRQRKQYGREFDEVDYVSVGGRAKVTEYEPQTEDMNYPYFNVQLDLEIQQVDRTGGGERLVGPVIRLKGVMLVREQDE